MNNNFSIFQIHFFAVPLDINYSNQSGLVNLYAVNTAKTLSAHGFSEQFTVGESEEQKNDSIGPSIYCYLNSPSLLMSSERDIPK